MSRRLLSVMASVAVVAGTVYMAAQIQALGQGGAAPAAPAAAGQGGAPGQGRGGGGRGGGGRGAAPQTAQAAATNDLTGYWMSVVTEDWRWRMAVPPKGDADSVPISAAGRAILDAWDPAKDEAAGNQCKGYGAGAISRLPTRVRVTWQDANTLKWETDQGMQTRLFRFGPAASDPGPPSWQGVSVATWEPAAGGRGGGLPGAGVPGPPGGAGAPGPAPAGVPVPPATDGDAAPPAAPAPGAGRGNAQNGWLKVDTTNLKSGYLRKNGLPYSEKTRVTEYFQPTPETYGVRYMIVTTIIEDPEYLTAPFITSSNYKKLPETNNGWDPQPCSVR